MHQKAMESRIEDLIIPLPRMSLTPPIPVQQVNAEGKNAKFFGYAVNLTREGIFVPTMNPKPVGFRTRIRFEIPKKKIVVEGEIEVVWSRNFDPKKASKPAGMGLKFVNLHEEKKLEIDAFIRA